MTQIAFHRERGKRKNLEDFCRAFLIKNPAPLPWQFTFLSVFDGVGGQKGGDYASYFSSLIISGAVSEFIARNHFDMDAADISPDAIIDMLYEAFHRANQEIMQRAGESEKLTGMATTAVCGLIYNDCLYVVWVGDSRCYLYRDSIIEPITRDHKEIELLIELGIIDRDQAHHHPLAHMINRYLGQPNEFLPALNIRRLCPGDIVVMCSDGLTDVISESQIATEINRYKAGRENFNCLPQRLVAQALRNNSLDNITVLVCEYQPEESSVPDSHRVTLTGAYPLAQNKIRQSQIKEV